MYCIQNSLWKFVCGINLHARQMYACVMNRSGEILFHRNMRTDFCQFKKKMQPFLPDLAVGVESTYMYYWLVDACRKEGIPFYLGHICYMLKNKQVFDEKFFVRTTMK